MIEITCGGVVVADESWDVKDADFARDAGGGEEVVGWVEVDGAEDVGDGVGGGWRGDDGGEVELPLRVVRLKLRLRLLLVLVLKVDVLFWFSGGRKGELGRAGHGLCIIHFCEEW